MLEVRAEPVVPETVSHHIDLAKTTYDTSTATDPDHFWWKHGLGPDGRSSSVNLYDGDRMVGRSVIMPRKFCVEPGVTRQAGLVADLLLAPSHRSALNFVALVRGQSAVQDIDLLVHTSNETSDLLYRKFLRYPVAFDLKAYAIPIRAHKVVGKAVGRLIPRALEAAAAPWRLALRSAAAIAKIFSGVRIDAGCPSPTEFEAMMQGFQALAGAHFERSLAFLKWRFEKGPVFTGNIATVRLNERAIGYLVWRKLSLAGLEFIVLMDVAFSTPVTFNLRQALWLHLSGIAIREGADMVFTMVNTANPMLAKLVAPPLVPIPDTHLPHPTPIFVLPRDEGLSWLRGHGSTYLTLADIDYF